MPQYTISALLLNLYLISRSNRVAVCCDNKTLTAWEIIGEADIKNVYTNKNLHKGFIRDVAWDLNDKNILYSVGWDGMLYKHRLNNGMNCR